MGVIELEYASLNFLGKQPNSDIVLPLGRCFVGTDYILSNVACSLAVKQNLRGKLKHRSSGFHGLWADLTDFFVKFLYVGHAGQLSIANLLQSCCVHNKV